jgi:outer membrane lipoprotein carrier protein
MSVDKLPAGDMDFPAVTALKGHGFGRADARSKWMSALAAEGVRGLQNKFPQGLKPRSFFAGFLARLKSCPVTKHSGTDARGIEPASFAVSAKVFALCGSALLLAVPIFGGAQQAPSAHELAQRVDRHYNQLHSLKAGFTESYEGLGMQRSESGTLLLLKPGRMRWNYANPPGKLFVLDGKYAWFYSQGDPQVQRIQAKQLDDLRSPLRFLLGHTELEKEMDTLTLSPASGGHFTLSGQPKGLEKRVNRLSVTVTAEGTITGIDIEEADGAITRFTFTGELTNAAIPAEEFHFVPPAGVPVVNAAPPV